MNIYPRFLSSSLNVYENSIVEHSPVLECLPFLSSWTQSMLKNHWTQSVLKIVEHSPVFENSIVEHSPVLESLPFLSSWTQSILRNHWTQSVLKIIEHSPYSGTVEHSAYPHFLDPHTVGQIAICAVICQMHFLIGAYIVIWGRPGPRLRQWFFTYFNNSGMNLPGVTSPNLPP